MTCTINRMISGAGIDDARARKARADRGFGALTGIDVTVTMKSRRGVGMPANRILGACIPKLAHRAV